MVSLSKLNISVPSSSINLMVATAYTCWPFKSRGLSRASCCYHKIE